MTHLNDMTDLSFTQTSRVMTSRPLNRSSGTYKPMWQIAAENNAKPKAFIDRKAKGLRSNPTVFMGC